MGWNKTSVEGKVMWEDSGGVRVSSTEEVDAIEKSRKLPPPRNFMVDFPDNDEEEVIDGELGPVGMCVVIGIMVILMLIIGIVSRSFPS